MKTRTGILLIVFISALVIAFSKVERKMEEDAYVPKKAIIVMDGKDRDTIFQHGVYLEAGARIIEWDRVTSRPNRQAEVVGTVNPEVVGIYYIDYDGEDYAGNLLTTITRTVHVVENSASFLNGVYNVSCNCTAIDDTTVTTANYMATVSVGAINNSVRINNLAIGDSQTRSYTLLVNDSVMQVVLNACDIDSPGSVFGKLSPSKNSFTIESAAVLFYPPANYIAKWQCRNIFKGVGDK